MCVSWVNSDLKSFFVPYLQIIEEASPTVLYLCHVKHTAITLGVSVPLYRCTSMYVQYVDTQGPIAYK